MPGDETKQRILDCALTLFSQRGFQAVSIRDICKEVRIKESSVYYHFTNKHAILEALQARFQAVAAGLMGQLEEALAAPWDRGGFSGEGVAKVFFEQYLMDDFCNRFLRLLSLAQNGDEAMRQLYDHWLFAEPLAFQTKVFALLFPLSPQESADLAVKYYAPIFFYCQRYLMSGELTPEKKALFCQKAAAHIGNFFKENGVG